MTTGDPTPPDFDFDAIIQGSGFVDPGMVRQMDTLEAYEKALNGEGGTASIGYHSVLNALNAEWPQHGADTHVSGRIYLFGNVVDSDVFERAIQLWGEPVRTDTTTYWDVIEAKLMSRGIVDDGDQTVKLVCAFSFEDDEVPSFTTRRDEASVSYSRLTREGGESYLRREWSEIIDYVDELVPEYDVSPDALPAILRKVTEKYNDELYGHDELCRALSEYVTYRIAFNQTAAYAIVLNGPLDLHNDDGATYPLMVSADKLRYVYRPAVVFSNVGEVAEVKLVVSDGDGSSDDTILVIPIDSIVDFQSTYSQNDLLEQAASAREYRLTDSGVELREEDVSIRVRRLEELRGVQMAINEMIEYAKRLQAHVCDTVEDALELAQACTYTVEKIAEQAEISEYLLVVEGIGIGLPPSRYEINGEMSEAVSIRALEAMGFMESGDQRKGYNVGLHPSYTIMEDDEGEKITPTLGLQLKIASHVEIVSRMNEVPTDEIVINSSAAVPLDGSSIITVDQLDIEEIIDSALNHLLLEGQNDMVQRLEVIYWYALEDECETLHSQAISSLHVVAR